MAGSMSKKKTTQVLPSRLQGRSQFDCNHEIRNGFNKSFRLAAWMTMELSKPTRWSFIHWLARNALSERIHQLHSHMRNPISLLFELSLVDGMTNEPIDWCRAARVGWPPDGWVRYILHLWHLEPPDWHSTKFPSGRQTLSFVLTKSIRRFQKSQRLPLKSVHRHRCLFGCIAALLLFLNFFSLFVFLKSLFKQSLSRFINLWRNYVEIWWKIKSTQWKNKQNLFTISSKEWEKASIFLFLLFFFLFSFLISRMKSSNTLIRRISVRERFDRKHLPAAQTTFAWQTIEFGAKQTNINSSDDVVINSEGLREVYWRRIVSNLASHTACRSIVGCDRVFVGNKSRQQSSDGGARMRPAREHKRENESRRNKENRLEKLFKFAHNRRDGDTCHLAVECTTPAAE